VCGVPHASESPSRLEAVSYRAAGCQKDQRVVQCRDPGAQGSRGATTILVGEGPVAGRERSLGSGLET